MSITSREIAKNEQPFYYHNTFLLNDGKTIERDFEKNRIDPKDRTILNIFSEINSRARGASESLALIGRSAKFLTPFMSGEAAHLTHHVSNNILKARSALALPFMFTALKQFREELSIRTTCQLISTTCHASALFVLGATAKTLSGTGSLFKAFGDSKSCYDSVNKFFETKALCILASKADHLSTEVKSGLNSEWYEQVFKIFKFGLAAIAGLATGFAFCTGATLPLALGTTLLGATVLSAGFGIAADYTLETADYIPFKA